MAASSLVEAAVPEEGLDTRIIAKSYSDYMLIGKTGLGKSTTANKLLRANPTGIEYGSDHGDQYIKVWWAPDDHDSQEHITTRVKNLLHSRIFPDKPHSGDATGSPPEVNNRTLKCELYSNEKTKVRVLDVPGFFAEILGDQLQPYTPSQVSEVVNTNHLAILRQIIRIQTVMQMRFKQILYFLPCRDVLELNDATFQQQLKLIVHHFGRSIFETMVLVATLGPTTYAMIPEGNPVEMPTEHLEKSRQTFYEALKIFIPENTPNPPIIFISLRETCESILEKVKRVRVARSDLQLEFRSSVCARCGIMIGTHNGKEEVCVYGDDWTKAILYDESHCHPILIPKYGGWRKFGLQLAEAVKALMRGELKWPELDDEICPICDCEPGTRGCTFVKTTVEWQDTSIQVDHTNSALEGIETEPQGDNAPSGTSSDQPAEAADQNPLEIPVHSIQESSYHMKTYPGNNR